MSQRLRLGELSYKGTIFDGVVSIRFDSFRFYFCSQFIFRYLIRCQCTRNSISILSMQQSIVLLAFSIYTSYVVWLSSCSACDIVRKLVVFFIIGQTTSSADRKQPCKCALIYRRDIESGTCILHTVHRFGFCLYSRSMQAKRDCSKYMRHINVLSMYVCSCVRACACVCVCAFATIHFIVILDQTIFQCEQHFENPLKFLNPCKYP